MKLHSWLSLSHDTLKNYTTIYLISNTYSAVTISLLLNRVQKYNGMSYKYCDVSENKSYIEQQFAISFLGQQQWYWLGSLDNLTANQQKYWLDYLKNYQGPHQIWCHTKEHIESHETRLIITLPDVVDFNDFVEISKFLFPTLSQERCNLFKKIFENRKSLPLDIASIIMYYASILSVHQIKQFITEWIDTLIIPEYSLFTLSTLFFSKDIVSFLMLWGSFKKTYSVHFWISYWSDQLFRAYHYIYAKRSQDVFHAKKFAYRLPFSFIQRDWKHYNPIQLSKFHQKLYELDFNIKQGIDEQFLDLWIYESITY